MLTPEQRNGAIGIALRAENDCYDDRILEMIFQTFITIPEQEAVEFFDFWVTYRPWTNQLARALVNFEERRRKELEVVQDFISYKI
jgi:hypothetical protein